MLKRHRHRRKMKFIMRKKLISFICVLLAAVLVSCQSTTSGQPDYSDPSLWAYWAIGDEKRADVFLICPTVDMGQDGNMNMSLDDAELRESFLGALNMERGIYEDWCTLYAPYYRQITFPLYSADEKVMEHYLETAYSDVEDAFFYYLENCNDGRPVVLAGFSQGAQLALMLLEDHFDDEALQEQLVAAYCIGWRVTDDDLNQYSHLRLAQDEDDTGVIIAFSSEAEGVEDSIIVPEGVITHAINPLNWKTDSTPAASDENLGACFTDYSGAVTKEVKNLCGAYIDPHRGTLRVTGIAPEDYSNSLFPDGVYHLYDYQFFFRNLQENVGVRVNAFFEQKESSV